jgi:uncharacterized membrane protein YfcA
VNDLLLVAVALFTSMLTAIFGLGGGMILIALMPGLLPASAIIPVHAAVQLSSNISRAAFAYRDIHWEFAVSFTIGAVLGGLLAGQVAQSINLDYIPLFIAAFILFNVWGPGLEFRKGHKGEFVSIGFLQTGLGVLVGATSPLGQSTLLRKGIDRDALVVTSAIFMSISHAIKVIVFLAIGFSFAQYWRLCLGMIIAMVLGSYVGTHMRHRVPNERFQYILKLVLTFLALRMIYISLV